MTASFTYNGQDIETAQTYLHMTGKENVVYAYNKVFSLKKEGKSAICDHIDETEGAISQIC